MKFLERINAFVWGAPALMMIVCVGLFLSFRTGFVQIRLFPAALKQFWRQLKNGGGAQYKALCTALAATVGTGNIIGVAGAITIGGPGAVFWMWMCGILGMATKFAEGTLAIRYRERGRDGYSGGPMFMIKNGLGTRWNWLAMIYCIFGTIASFGVGNATQINAITLGVGSILDCVGIVDAYTVNLLVGIIIAAIIAFVLLGGGNRIGDVAVKVVPFASIGYILLCCAALVVNFSKLPTVFALIIEGAFAPRAVTGGLVGSFFLSLRVGASRGTFTNEAGMGTASIAHATADVSHPVKQGLMGIIEVFLDTILMCTLTAFVILSADMTIPYGSPENGLLTGTAFSKTLGAWTVIPLSLFICCFAFATILGWSLYGGKCAQYLFGEKSWRVYVLVQSAVVVIGAIANIESVWSVSEILNGLMILPNLLVLVALSPELLSLLQSYSADMHSG